MIAELNIYAAYKLVMADKLISDSKLDDTMRNAENRKIGGNKFKSSKRATNNKKCNCSGESSDYDGT